MSWHFTFDGHVFDEGDVTVGQWSEICDIAEMPWALLNPLRSPKCAIAIFTVLVADHTGEDRDAVKKTITDMTTSAFLELFTEEEGDDLPTEYANGIPQ